MGRKKLIIATIATHFHFPIITTVSELVWLLWATHISFQLQCEYFWWYDIRKCPWICQKTKNITNQTNRSCNFHGICGQFDGATWNVLQCNHKRYRKNEEFKSAMRPIQVCYWDWEQQAASTITITHLIYLHNVRSDKDLPEHFAAFHYLEIFIKGYPFGSFTTQPVTRIIDYLYISNSPIGLHVREKILRQPKVIPSKLSSRKWLKLNRIVCIGHCK